MDKMANFCPLRFDMIVYSILKKSCDLFSPKCILIEFAISNLSLICGYISEIFKSSV